MNHEHDGKYIHPVFPFRYRECFLEYNGAKLVDVLFTRDFGKFKIGEKVEVLFYSVTNGILSGNGKEQKFAVYPL